ncbi:hypothetical protein NL676_003338 [Syzygium grande]|nr:hypothetical protein NL676_003338 [Syzygium grande]
MALRARRFSLQLCTSSSSSPLRFPRRNHRALFSQTVQTIRVEPAVLQPHPPPPPRRRSRPSPGCSRDPSRFPGQGAHEKAKSSRISQLYSAFPFGFCANPDPVSSAALDGVEHAGGDDPRRVWADSVKKKRKRKMNKHKYKKLRKRRRRKAKS